MISIIISSVNPEHLKRVSNNIKDTVGVPYELITFENSSGEKGICEIYNLGICKAQYDIFCFMHEDLEIKTENWGKIVAEHFASIPDLGLLGIAGSTYKTSTPAGWHSAGAGTSRANFIQSHKRSDIPPIHYYANPNNEEIAEVACLDGVWLCTTKKIASEFWFDDTTFKKFHGYDLDFSLAIGQKYKVAVTFKVLLDHFSEGNYDSTWMAESLKLHEKWNNILPVNTSNTPLDATLKIEKTVFKIFIDELIQLKYPVKTALVALANCRKYFRLKPLLITKLKYHIFSKYLLKKQVS
jgi:hypothetical protein